MVTGGFGGGWCVCFVKQTNKHRQAADPLFWNTRCACTPITQQSRIIYFWKLAGLQNPPAVPPKASTSRTLADAAAFVEAEGIAADAAYTDALNKAQAQEGQQVTRRGGGRGC